MTTSTLTLADFLLARIAEDEEETTRMHPMQQNRSPWNPLSRSRVLAECDAKRRIVAEHSPFHSGDYCAAHGGRYLTDQCPTLLALALPYADHPDYDEGWRP